MLYASSYLPGGSFAGTLATLFDGASHPLSAYYGTLAAAQVTYPFATSLANESAWAVVQKAWNAAGALALGYRPTVCIDAEGVGIVNRPLVPPEGLHCYGQGRANTKFKALNGGNSGFVGGPVVCCLSPLATQVGGGGGGPWGDANGFVLNNPAGAYVDLSERAELNNYTLLDGSWWFEVQLRWDSGGGYIWGVGNTLATGVGKSVLAALNCDATGKVRAYTNDFLGGSASVQLTAGVFSTIRVTVNADGTGSMTVDGTPYALSGTLAPVAANIGWYTALVLGGRPDRFPWVLASEGAPNGRVKNVKLGTRFGDSSAALTDGNTPFFAHPADAHPSGFLFARPAVDLGGLGTLNLHDFAVEGTTGNIGLYVNNCQNSTFRRIQVDGGGAYGMVSHKNTYSNRIQDCLFFAVKAAAVGTQNAGQTPWDNCVFQGGTCGFASENSYATQIRGGWIFNVSGADSVSLLLAGAGCTHAVSDLVCFDEGVGTTGPRWLALLRETNATFRGVSIFRNFTDPNYVIAIDRGGPYSFEGGQVGGRLDQPSAIFQKLAAPSFAVEVRRVWRGDAPGATNPAPWTAAANDPDFLIDQTALVTVGPLVLTTGPDGPPRRRDFSLFADDDRLVVLQTDGAVPLGSIADLACEFDEWPSGAQLLEKTVGAGLTVLDDDTGTMQLAGDELGAGHFRYRFRSRDPGVRDTLAWGKVSVRAA